MQLEQTVFACLLARCTMTLMLLAGLLGAAEPGSETLVRGGGRAITIAPAQTSVGKNITALPGQAPLEVSASPFAERLPALPPALHPYALGTAHSFLRKQPAGDQLVNFWTGRVRRSIPRLNTDEPPWHVRVS